MSYYVVNVIDLGPAYTGVTLEAQIHDSEDGAIGSPISGIFFERAGAKGIYAGAVLVPDGTLGWIDVYVSGNSSLILATLPINPAEIELNAIGANAAAAIMAYLLMGARSTENMLLDIWAVIVGNATANDATNPTFIQYQNPATGGQIGHILDDTTRTID